MKKRIFVLVMTIAFLLGSRAQNPVEAATRLTEEFADLVRASQAIVVGEALRVQNEPASKLGIPMTVVDFRVDKVYQGKLSTGVHLEVEYLGGPEGKSQIVVPGQPELKPGEHALLLLISNNGRWRVLGGGVGQVALFRDDSGKTLARRTEGRFDYFITDPGSVTGYRRCQSALISTDTMDKLLGTILASGKPVIDDEPSPIPVTATSAAPDSITAALEKPYKNHNPLVYALCGVFFLLLALRQLGALKGTKKPATKVI